MRQVAAAHDASVAQVALAWLLHQPAVTSVILGAKRPEQLADNIGAASLALSSDDLAALDAASALPAEYPGWMIERQSSARAG
jgi:aryl-alcohol dehydrogenase-like predicted oxidoreductase